MNELLRLANELIAAREKAPISPWKNTPYITEAGDGKSIFHDDERLNNSSEFIVLAGNHAVDIIKGYQDLLRRIVATWDVTDEHQIPSPLYSVMTEARASIPEEP